MWNESKNAINPPLLQNTGGSCVIYTTFRRGTDLHNHNKYSSLSIAFLKISFLFTCDAQEPMDHLKEPLFPNLSTCESRHRSVFGTRGRGKLQHPTHKHVCTYAHTHTHHLIHISQPLPKTASLGSHATALHRSSWSSRWWAYPP